MGENQPELGTTQVKENLVKVVQRLARLGYRGFFIVDESGRPIHRTSEEEDKLMIHFGVVSGERAIKLIERRKKASGVGVDLWYYYNKYFDFSAAALRFDNEQAGSILNELFFDWRVRLCASRDSLCIRDSSGAFTVVFRYPRVYHIVLRDESSSLPLDRKKLPSGVEINLGLVVVYGAGAVPVRWGGDWRIVEANDVGSGEVVGEREFHYLAKTLGFEYY